MMRMRGGGIHGFEMGFISFILNWVLKKLSNKRCKKASLWNWVLLLRAKDVVPV